MPPVSSPSTRPRPPVAVAVTSTEFPSNPDNTASIGSPAGTVGSFLIDAQGKTDITKVRVAIDDPTVPLDYALNVAGGKVTVPLVPMSEGKHVLYIKTVDSAGNVSTTTNGSYVFYATAANGTLAWHDMTGDNTPDLYGHSGTTACLYVGLPASPWWKTGGRCNGPVQQAIAVADKPAVSGPWSVQTTDSGGHYNDAIAVKNNAFTLYKGTGGGSFTIPAEARIKQDDDITFADATGTTDLIGTGDWGGDGDADFLTRDSSGDLWLYRNDGCGRIEKVNGTGAYRTKVGTGWNGLALTVPGDVNHDGHPDVIAATTDGVLWLYPGTGNQISCAKTQIGTGWNIFDVLTSTGDINQDGWPDLVARSKSTGDLYYYLHSTNTANPYPGSVSTKAGVGWNGFTRLFRPGTTSSMLNNHPPPKDGHPQHGRPPVVALRHVVGASVPYSHFTEG